MKIESIDDCGIRSFVEDMIRKLGKHNTIRALISIVEGYSDPIAQGIRAQKEGLNDLSFVLILLFNWIQCKDSIINAVITLVDQVACEMQHISEGKVNE